MNEVKIDKIINEFEKTYDGKLGLGKKSLLGMFLEFLNEHHKTQTKKDMPTDEEIDKKFFIDRTKPLGNLFNTHAASKRWAAKWLKQKLLKK